MNQGNFNIALSCRVEASEQLGRDFKLNDESYDLNLWTYVTKQWGQFFLTVFYPELLIPTEFSALLEIVCMWAAQHVNH